MPKYVIVVVETDDVCRMVICEYLRLLVDAVVFSFSSAMEVVGELAQADLILCNVGAPRDEQNLDAIVRRLGEEGLAVPIIAMSCCFFPDDDLEKKARELGVAVCLCKPYVRDELERALALALPQ